VVQALLTSTSSPPVLAADPFRRGRDAWVARRIDHDEDSPELGGGSLPALGITCPDEYGVAGLR